MASHLSATVGERFDAIVRGERTDDALVALLGMAPFITGLSGVDLRQYYFDPAEKMRVQLWLQDQFPEFILLPGIWGDFGALCEPSAFGCPIEWLEGGMPAAKPCLGSTADVAALKVPDPLRDGYAPRVLDDYRYFQDHLDPRYIERYGYLDGVAISMGPGELAAVLMGQGEFFVNLLEEPQAIHELLAKTTEWCIRWYRAHEAVNGALKRLILVDHLPGQISREHFEEFVLPYTNRVLAEFSGAHILYHNEYPVPYLPALAQLDMDIFHFGGPLSDAKAALGDKVTLMGNLDPLELLTRGSAEEVYAQSLTALEAGSPGGRFLLSSAGGMAPETSLAALSAMNRAVTDFRAGKGLI
jgi:uroporphyrinogen-III decarboxylase